MNPVLLDTHVVIWGATGDRKLGRRARQLIGKAIDLRCAWISAISFWEVALLILRDDLEVDGTPADWRRMVLGKGLQELPLTGEAAIRGALALPYHGDPGDRMIVGASLSMGATLVTGDAELLDWSGKLPRHNARQ